jgi:hypothetical protein
MALGRKTGGRTRGTPNRRTQDIQSLLTSMGCDPIEGMARIAMDLQHPVEVRARMYVELAQYVAPKRRAVQMDVGDTNRVFFNIGIPSRHSRQVSQHRPILPDTPKEE